MITFVKTRWKYDSYTDFWKLVELSGFPTVYIDEMDLYDAENTYILSPANGELPQFMGDKANRRLSKVLLWNLERPGGSNNSLEKYIQDNRALIDAKFIDNVIVSDRALASQCGFIYVPVGSHAGLGMPGDFAEKEYDLIHLSCYSNNRSWLFDTPSHPKSNISGLSIAPNGWGESRDSNLRKARVMLNVHQDGFRYLEPLRFALAAAYGLPIVSEPIYDKHPYAIAVVTSDDPVMTARYGILPRYDYWYSDAMAMRNFMTFSFSFRQCLEMFL